MQTATIEHYEGQLVIVPTNWETNYAEPTEYRHSWPTSIPARGDDTRIGIVGQLDSVGFHFDYGAHYIPLTEGGATKSVRYETRPVKMPRRNKAYSWEWRYGSWVRVYS